MNFAGYALEVGKITKTVAHTRKTLTENMINHGKCLYHRSTELNQKVNGYTHFVVVSINFRWEHYLKQYATHKNSLRLEKLMMEEESINQKFKGFLDVGISWHAVSYPESH